MGLNDYINSPEKLRRLGADFGAMWPFFGLVIVGAIVAEPRALHLTRNMSGNMWAFLPWQFWAFLAAAIFVACFVWVHWVVSKGIAESKPSVALAKKFLRFTGSLNAEEQECLDTLIADMHLTTDTPTQVHIVGGLNDLARKDRTILQTDGHTKIWISDPYRCFALEWSIGRTKVEKTASSEGALKSHAQPATIAGEGRRLSAVQSAQIVQALRGRVGKLIIYSYAVAPDSHDLAEDFAAAFRKAGWQAELSMLPTKPMVPPPTGIAIELPGTGAPQPDPQMADVEVRTLVGGAMSSAGLSVDVRARCENWSWAQCCIVVGRKPPTG